VVPETFSNNANSLGVMRLDIRLCSLEPGCI